MENLIERLKELAEYAEPREWDLPLDLADVLRVAAEELEKMRWVPVTERLPEVGRKVLISWTANGEICFDTAFRLIDGWSATHWELSADVTHWIPLPEPPEDKP